jgi:thiol-disulfide isomerase/thioredoxin
VRRLETRLDREDLAILKNERRVGRYSFNARERNCLFVNGRGRRFVEAGYPLGVDVDLEGRGVAVADLDEDGALDLVVRSNARRKLTFFHNEVAGKNGFLRVELLGTRSNRDAVGALVRIVAGGLRQMRVKMAGSGFQGQSEGTLHFGLGGATRVDSLEVRWPSGLRESFRDLPRDHVVRIVEGEGRYAARRPAGWRPARARVEDGAWKAWTLQGEPYVPPPGRSLVVSLWASWCKACREESPTLGALFARLPADMDMVGISFDERDAESALAFLRATSPRYPVAVSTREALSPLLSRAFGEGGVPLPAAVLLDAKGAVARVYGGKLAADAVLRDARALSR